MTEHTPGLWDYEECMRQYDMQKKRACEVMRQLDELVVALRQCRKALEELISQVDATIAKAKGE